MMQTHWGSVRKTGFRVIIQNVTISRLLKGFSIAMGAVDHFELDVRDRVIIGLNRKQ